MKKLDGFRAYKIFKMLCLARQEKSFSQVEMKSLFRTACQYGASIEVTEEECRIVSEMKIKDVLKDWK